MSQSTGCPDVRHARFIGLAKVQLQHVCTALGLNMLRLGAWLADGTP